MQFEEELDVAEDLELLEHGAVVGVVDVQLDQAGDAVGDVAEAALDFFAGRDSVAPGGDGHLGERGARRAREDERG